MHETAHEVEVGLGGVGGVDLNGLLSAAETAAGLFEGTSLHGRSLALLSEVSLHVLTGNAVSGGWTAVWAGHGEHKALLVMVLEGVRRETARAVRTADHPLGARVHLVGLEPVPLDLLAALVLAVDWLEAALHLVFLDGGASEVLLAVGAGDETFGARVQHVVFHHHAGDLGSALVEAADGVLLTRVEVTLQLVELATPLATLVLKK